MAFGLLAVVALASAVSGTPAATPPSDLRMAANTPITFRACNHTKTAVLIGSSFIPIGGRDWRNKGWTVVNAGACGDIFKTDNRTFYARAEVRGHSDQSWGSDIAQCVEYPGPYDFMTKSSDTTCPEGDPAKFTTFQSDGRPVYVWNLTP